ncbi:MAG: FAD-binding oxidoreductase [Actinobacteria bacterium]|nr:FAD-binding oxidoreductase [Actinomycetota bacterium]
MHGADVVVIGAGVVGLAAAWRLAEAGVAVVVVDAIGVGGGASSRNAGLIDAPGWGRRPALDDVLKMGSLAIYERLADDGADIELDRCGRVAAACTDDELALAAAEAAAHDGVHLLDGDALREVEPALGPAVVGGTWTPGAACADPVAACAALAAAAQRCGVRVIATARVTSFEPGPQGGARLGLQDGDHIDAGAVVLAAGAWAAPVARLLDEALDVPTVPVFGQMWATIPLPAGTLRTTVVGLESSHAWQGGAALDGLPLTHDAAGVRRTRHLYGRQRRNGEVVFGGDRIRLAPADHAATDPGAVPVVRDDGIAVNRAHAAAVAPVLGSAPTARTWAGVMPFARDGLPLIGPVPGVRGLMVAGGLGSSGFNRGPMAGWLAADLLLGRDVPPEVATARLDRRG